ncbi:hypothetical protein LGL55_21495 [Clostridium tagluense]|uniref:hypothetical protein n=1 Tax=Clostridium tagluense TaxID=360422 RepID=UPI001C0B6D2E|nr:hypothetical protein [Clostridium tagluense]MBU3130084.1 hypothetical protein [Clostridium tagluense]MCB2313743.1 hypothetical protein [Clostridium tagluense]MCB2318523.1 hypothetical protein [Clostridium tagluense]MCB2323405.1 hypothetical protein [Clostridium tagluense]MCB2328313.1 hypothetical protein [Clostridium tagluense]
MKKILSKALSVVVFITMILPSTGTVFAAGNIEPKINVVNNVGIPDTVTVTGLVVGDIVKVYSVTPIPIPMITPQIIATPTVLPIPPVPSPLVSTLPSLQSSNQKQIEELPGLIVKAIPIESLERKTPIISGTRTPATETVGVLHKQIIIKEGPGTETPAVKIIGIVDKIGEAKAKAEKAVKGAAKGAAPTVSATVSISGQLPVATGSVYGNHELDGSGYSISDSDKNQEVAKRTKVGKTRAAGSVYVSVTRNGLKESFPQEVEYQAEQRTPLKGITVETPVNNAGIPDTLKVTGLEVGDIVKVYSALTSAEEVQGQEGVTASNGFLDTSIEPDERFRLASLAAITKYNYTLDSAGGVKPLPRERGDVGEQGEVGQYNAGPIGVFKNTIENVNLRTKQGIVNAAQSAYTTAQIAYSTARAAYDTAYNTSSSASAVSTNAAVGAADYARLAALPTATPALVEEARLAALAATTAADAAAVAATALAAILPATLSASAAAERTEIILNEANALSLGTIPALPNQYLLLPLPRPQPTTTIPILSDVAVKVLMQAMDVFEDSLVKGTPVGAPLGTATAKADKGVKGAPIVATATVSMQLPPITGSDSTGKVYVSVTRKGLLESDKIAPNELGLTNYPSEQKTPMSASMVTIFNNALIPDIVIVKNLKVGDIVNIYKDGFTESIGTVTAKADKTVKGSAATATATISITQLGESAGKIRITVTSRTFLESNKSDPLDYSEEGQTNPPALLK